MRRPHWAECGKVVCWVKANGHRSACGDRWVEVYLGGQTIVKEGLRKESKVSRRDSPGVAQSPKDTTDGTLMIVRFRTVTCKREFLRLSDRPGPHRRCHQIVLPDLGKAVAAWFLLVLVTDQHLLDPIPDTQRRVNANTRACVGVILDGKGGFALTLPVVPGTACQVSRTDRLQLLDFGPFNDERHLEIHMELDNLAVFDDRRAFHDFYASDVPDGLGGTSYGLLGGITPTLCRDADQLDYPDNGGGLRMFCHSHDSLLIEKGFVR